MTPVDICMVVHNRVDHDSRVQREAAALAAQGWHVVVVGVAMDGDIPPETEVMDGYTVVYVAPRLLRRWLPGKTGKRLRILASWVLVARRLRQINARVYHGHDFTGLLSIALAGIRRRPVVYDSHELFFDMKIGGQFRLNDLMRLLRPLEKVLARRAAAVITVNDSLADHLAQKLDIPRPLVLWNTVDLRRSEPPAATFPLDGKSVVVHSGGMSYGRHLPELVAALAHLPPEVGLVLLGDGYLKDSLLQQAQSLGIADRVAVVPTVPVKTVAPTLAQAQVAAVLISSAATSFHFSLPNKLFEAIAAGLPVVASPIPEVKALVDRYGLGLTCDPTDPAAIAAAIRTILQPEQYKRFRTNAEKAREELNWEHEEKKLIALYQRLLGG
ncbi:MAG: glycosyltransferase [Chloroflexi bacterium]|nr:glycosyltransferase [Chloroflexota bacterium]